MGFTSGEFLQVCMGYFPAPKSPNPIISTQSGKCEHTPNRRWLRCLHRLKLIQASFAKLLVALSALPGTCFSRIPSENLTYATFSLERPQKTPGKFCLRFFLSYTFLMFSGEPRRSAQNPFRTSGPEAKKKALSIWRLPVIIFRRMFFSPRHTRVVTEIYRYLSRATVFKWTFRTVRQVSCSLLWCMSTF